MGLDLIGFLCGWMGCDAFLSSCRFDDMMHPHCLYSSMVYTVRIVFFVTTFFFNKDIRNSDVNSYVCLFVRCVRDKEGGGMYVRT